MTKDLHISEYGSGGDLTVLGNDLTLVESLLQMTYIALFGGNIEASTTGNEIDTEQRSDWWGNGLFFSQQPERQFNSITERVLGTTVLNSAGRVAIQRAVESDLQHLREFADVTVEVSILTGTRVEIAIKLLPLDNQEEKSLQLLFDNATNEIIIENEI